MLYTYNCGRLPMPMRCTIKKIRLADAKMPPINVRRTDATPDAGRRASLDHHHHAALSKGDSSSNKSKLQGSAASSSSA